jgi:adenosine deaminase
LEQAHAAGVVRAEMFLGPQTFVDQGVPIDDILGGVFEAIDEAGRDLGISAALLVSAPGTAPSRTRSRCHRSQRRRPPSRAVR